MSSFLDKNYRSIDGVSEFVDTRYEVVPPLPETLDGIDDTLKVSNSSGVEIARKEIYNRGEDCLDLCRVSNSTFDTLVLHPGGRNGITVKGASSFVYIEAAFLCNGSECDVELGQFDNYWFPGRGPTRKISLELRIHEDAVSITRPPLVRVWDATDITVVGEHRLQKIPKVVWFPYFLFRYAALRATNLWRRLTRQTPIKVS